MCEWLLWIWFYCVFVVLKGGVMLIVDSCVVYCVFDLVFVVCFEKCELLYVCNFG